MSKSTLGIAAIVALLFVAVAAWAVTNHSPPGVIGHEAKIIKNVLAIDFQPAIVQPGAVELIGGMPAWTLPEGAMSLRSHAVTAPANVEGVHPLRC